VIGLDIGSSAIKVVQLRKKGAKAVLETYGELALGPYAGIEIGRATALTQDRILSALRDLLKESAITTNECGIAVSAGSSLITFINLPTDNEKQIAGMVPLEARKYVPVPISEVMLDWTIIPNDNDKPSEFEMGEASKRLDEKKPMTEIMLAVIRNDVMNELAQITETLKLSNNLYEIEIFASSRAVLDQSLEAQMVFDMGAASTKLYIIEKGILRASHTVSRGSQDITLAISRALNMTVGEAEHNKRNIGISEEPEHKNMKEAITLTLDYIFTETNRALFGYSKKHSKNVSKIVLTGGGSLLKGFLELAKTRLETQVVLGDPFAKTEAPAFLEPVLKNAGPEFAVAIGLALKQLQDR
jgi:type IV pilus assembly protein PilM